MNIKLFFFYFLLFYSVVGSAQTFEEYKRQQQAKFNIDVQKQTEEFRAYRDRVNVEYADFVRRG